MSKEQQHPQHPYQTRGAQKRSSIAEQQQQKRERESQEQQQMTAPKGQQQSFEQQQIQQNNTKLQMKSSSAAASESEENNSGSGSNNSTATSGYQQFLQKQNSMFSNTNSNNSNSQFSMYSSGAVARMDDEDPIFTLDEEVHAKAIERTRHYTADFDPTVSDDDEFQKDLHGGRAYSVSTRFPPRVRHSGRSGHPHQNTTGILHHHKLGGESFGSAAPPPIIPASLPIQISRGFQWPPRELVGSLSEEEETNLVTAEKCGGGLNLLERARARTTINPFSADDIDTGEANVQQQKMGGGQNQNGSEREEQGQQEGEDLYGRMQAYSRSIQPEDDPERIFGERPHRRYSISIKHVHPTVAEGANHNDGGGELLLETSEELGGGGGGNDPNGEDSIGGENIPPGLMANINNNSNNIPTAANPMGIIGQPSAGNGGGGNGTPRIIVPASLRG